MAMLAILAACHKYFACGNEVLFCSVLFRSVFSVFSLLLWGYNDDLGEFTWEHPIVKRFSVDNFLSRQNRAQKWRFFGNYWV